MLAFPKSGSGFKVSKSNPKNVPNREIRQPNPYLAVVMVLAAFQRINWKRTEWVLVALLLGLALWPVWANAFFLTNDGPCHLYNARILRDMLLGNDSAFYAEWFTLNPNIEPNWLNHFLLTVFQLVFPPVFSEKLFLTLYILGFVFAFRYLARSIYPANGAFLLVAMPFLFHKVFLMGFFNYSASVILFFVLVGFWLRNFEKEGWRWRMVLGTLMLVLGLSHPVSYAMAMGTIFFHWVGQFLAGVMRADRGVKLKALALLALKTILAALPSLMLLGSFILRKGTDSIASQAKPQTIFEDFVQLRALILFHPGETTWPIVLSILIAVMLMVGLFSLSRQSKGHTGILLMLGTTLVVYFFQPAVVAGVGIMPERLQIYPYLIAIIWLACRPWPTWMLRSAALIGFLVAGILFSIRLPNYANTSLAVEEFVSVQPHMRPHSTVLMLDYAPEGRYPNEGPLLSDEAYIFMHIAEYLGALQPHIILNNYEANTHWFPLRWNPDKDPYVHLGEGPGFEGWLPTVNFEKFRMETGKDVDYVITWCLNNELRQYEGVKLMQDRLKQDYTEVLVTEGGRVRLWERKRP